VVSAAAAKLRRFVRPRRLGVVLAGDAGFVLRRRPDTVRAPDVAFVCRARIPNPPPDTFIEGAPDLAVEVLSPQDRAAAAARKAAEYLRAGTRLVWVIDPAGGPAAGPSARVYTRRGVRTISRDGVLTGGRVLPGFRVRLSDLIA
jgi:Uma2 family endonuclease